MNLMRRGQNALTHTARALARAGIVRPFVSLYARVLARHTLHPRGPVSPTAHRDPEHTDPPRTLLAINADRFRGDLEALAATGRFRVIALPFRWQARILGLFWPRDGSKFTLDDYAAPTPGSRADTIRGQLATFLDRFLPALAKRLGIDATIGAAIHYIHDLDWAEASERAGIPYIVLQRENLATNEGHVRFYTKRLTALGSFKGTAIVVHNEAIRNVFIDSGFIDDDRIHALGAPRMDGMIERIQHRRSERARDRPLVVLFSFNHCAGMYGVLNAWSPDGRTGFVQLFREVHETLARFAAAHPEVDVLIKPKWGADWVTRIEDVLRGAHIDPSTLPNLRIDPDVAAHDAIADADVVLGFGSTTVLEAGVAGIPVVYPIFAEAATDVGRPYVHFLHEADMFDVARSPDDMTRLIEARLVDPSIDEGTLKARRAAFERYVSSLSGDATRRYGDTLEAIIEGRVPGTTPPPPAPELEATT